MTIVMNGHSLSRDQVMAIARAGAVVSIDPKAESKVNLAAQVIQEKVAAGEVVYGVTTGFGSNADKLLPNAAAADRLQRNLIVTHAVCVGDPLDEALVRALMAIRINTLLQGHSGIRLTTIETLVRHLNEGLHPVIPAKGSVGASGDLAPLSHMAMPLLGEGEVIYRGERMSAAEALSRTGIEPVVLTYKEGLSLNNGTALMLACGCLALDDLSRLLKLADIAAGMSLEAMAGRGDAFRAEIHACRAHPGQVATAANIRALYAGSNLVDLDYAAVPQNKGAWTWNRELKRFEGGKAVRPQDSYSLRCVPQVHGAVKDAWHYVEGVMARELNSVTDNPIVIPDLDHPGKGEVLSAGNFHGMPLALALSFLKAAIPSLASISERRTQKLVDAANNDGLPSFLVRNDDATDSGFMIVQYTAAALVNDLATRAHPASVYSVPTSANAEDHVSMGANEGRHVLEMIGDLNDVIALELYTAAQALDVRMKTLDGTFWANNDWLQDVPEPHRDRLREHAQSMRSRRYQPGAALAAVHKVIRDQVGIRFIERDRPMAEDVAAMCRAVRENRLLPAAEAVAGQLDLGQPHGQPS